MVATLISHTITSSTGTSLLIARPDDVEEGDLLVFILTIGAVAAEADTLTYPSTPWRNHDAVSPVTGTGIRTFQVFKYAEEVEDSLYTFTYTASRPMVGTMLVIRGAVRDYDYDGVLYPYGYFAPGEPVLASSSVAATTVNAPAGLITTTTAYTLGFYLFTQYDSAAGSPVFDDPDPLVGMIHRTQTTLLGVLAMSELYEDIGIAPTISVRSSLSKPWVAVSIAIESADLPPATDNYKSKLLRRTLPPPYDTRASSTLGKVLTVIGTSDNEIGGLFGDDDFLPSD
jgi:hypothetical protein